METALMFLTQQRQTRKIKSTFHSILDSAHQQNSAPLSIRNGNRRKASQYQQYCLVEDAPLEYRWFTRPVTGNTVCLLGLQCEAKQQLQQSTK